MILIPRISIYSLQRLHHFLAHVTVSCLPHPLCLSGYEVQDSNHYPILMHMHSNARLFVNSSPFSCSQNVIWGSREPFQTSGYLAHLHKQPNRVSQAWVSDIFGLWFYNSTSSFFKSSGWMASHFDDLFKQFVRSIASCTHMIQNINVSCRCNFSCQLMHQGKMTFMLERCDFSTNSSLKCPSIAVVTIK